MTDPTSRLRWPRDGVAVRVPPRRSAAHGASCDVIAFSGTRAEAPKSVPWDRLADAAPRGSGVVLLVAAEDVSFTVADVPALSGMRLREALPNLVEDRTVGDVGTLHVALGHATGDGARTLAVVDRVWLAAMQVHVLRAGFKVAAIVPSSLAVPMQDDAWTFAAAGTGDAAGAWLRTGVQQAMPLPADATSAAAVAGALARGSARRAGRLTIHATGSDDVAAGETIAATLGVPATSQRGDPFVAWLAGGGPDGGYGPALSLLAFDGASPWSGWTRWRAAAALVVALVVVQLVGMQLEWAALRGEADGLRRQAAALVTTTFPDTKVVLDAPLQMARGLAALRASTGRSDPADFTATMAASARIFASLPSNGLRGADYEGRVLRLRFAAGSVAAADERDRFVAQAAQEGYALRFEPAANAAGEASATLRATVASGATAGSAS